MRRTVTVREYATLMPGDSLQQNLDSAFIGQDDFAWLLRQEKLFDRGGAKIVSKDGQPALRLENYVGIIQTPAGTSIEILPKTFSEEDEVSQARRMLRRMLEVANALPHREATPASLMRYDAPLNEWVARQFLLALDDLVKKGLRFDYLRTDEELQYLRGRLDIPRQIQQPAGRGHYFQVSHDVFSADRPENRLLMSALQQVRQSTGDSVNWRLAHELITMMREIPCSRDIEDDFARWRHDRLMAHYGPLRPWCELILSRQMPLAIAGEWQGFSLLFPMEKLFENFVQEKSRAALVAGYRLDAQSNVAYLCRHLEQGMFSLRPDIVISKEEERYVVDAKWKKLDGTKPSSNYGISQADCYQMLAYGQKYLEGKGDMALVYPLSSDFAEPLAPFWLSEELRLWVLPFDLEQEILVQGSHSPFPISSQ